MFSEESEQQRRRRRRQRRKEQQLQQQQEDEKEEDEEDEGDRLEIELPDLDVLEPSEGKIRGYLAEELVPFAAVRQQTEDRIRSIQTVLEFEVDQLADNVHKLAQRVDAADRQADVVLRLSALRLREREAREMRSAGTSHLPLAEVLRGLSGILPESS